MYDYSCVVPKLIMFDRSCIPDSNQKRKAKGVRILSTVTLLGRLALHLGDSGSDDSRTIATKLVEIYEGPTRSIVGYQPYCSVGTFD